MNDITEKYFHGINLSNYKQDVNLRDIDIFENILKFDKIMTRYDLICPLLSIPIY